jgi:hypothetical protein
VAFETGHTATTIFHKSQAKTIKGSRDQYSQVKGVQFRLRIIYLSHFLVAT